MRRRTIKNEASVSGIALHSGKDSKISFRAGSDGIVFIRSDLPGKPAIKATLSNVYDTKRGTSLRSGAAEVHVIEHVLSAVNALRITDLVIDISGTEPPALDGSAIGYFTLLKDAKIVDLAGEALPIKISREILVQDGSGVLIASPSDRFSISFMIDFSGTPIGTQEFSSSIDEKTFERDIAPARTFGFVEDVEALKKMGLALGASEKNALVVNKDGYVNKPRFKDEAVRHKVLDLIGDLGLLGRPLIARVSGERSGHKLNIALAALIEKEEKN